MDLKETLRIIAGSAGFGRTGANHDMAAVTALPHLDLALGEDFCHLHILQQSTIALLVVLLNSGDQTESGSVFGDALGLRVICKYVFYFGPLLFLGVGSVE